MAAYSVNDKVRLTSARGGWEGFVSEVLSGPEAYYHVHSPNWGDPDEGEAFVAESDIAAGPLTAPTFTVGDTVTLYGRSASITADNGDDTFDLTVDWTVNAHLELTRSHTVALWRLAIENT